MQQAPNYIKRITPYGTMDDELEALFKAWGYIEVACFREGLWQCRNCTDEGLGTDEEEITFEGQAPSEAIRKAYSSLYDEPWEEKDTIERM